MLFLCDFLLFNVRLLTIAVNAEPSDAQSAATLPPPGAKLSLETSSTKSSTVKVVNKS